MNNDKKILMEDFQNKTFDEKKEKLFGILRKLYGTRDVVNELGELVYGIISEDKTPILIEVYDILLDAISDADKLISEKSIEKIGFIQDTLKKMKKEEEENKLQENPEDVFKEL